MVDYAVCPSCGERILIDGQVDLGHRVTCNTCGDLLEVTSLGPIELDWIYYEDGDWEEW